MMLWLKRIEIISMLVVVSLLSGCAFGTREVMLAYPPPVTNIGMQVAHASTQTEKNGIKVIIGKLEDKRTVTHRIGNVRNGFGMDTADVVAKNNVRNWVVDALEWELKNAGYSVSKSETSRDNIKSAVMVSGEINQIYCDVYFNYDGKATVLLKAMQNGKNVVHNTYYGSGSAGANFAASSEAYGESLAKALQAAMNKFINELNMKLLK